MRAHRLSWLVTATVVALASCQEPATAIRVTVTFDPYQGIDQLAVEVVPDQGELQQAVVPATPAMLQSGLRVVLLIPDAWAGREALVKIKGLQGGNWLASGDGRATPVRDQVVELDVALEVGCADACTDGERRCSGAGYQLCAAFAHGCTDWGTVVACTGDTVCQAGLCVAPCDGGSCCGCAGKACGADDGCGHKCQTGSCTKAAETCQAGSCVCKPSCPAKRCGGDDGCGGACDSGPCPGGVACMTGVCSVPWTVGSPDPLVEHECGSYSSMQNDWSVCTPDPCVLAAIRVKLNPGSYRFSVDGYGMSASNPTDLVVRDSGSGAELARTAVTGVPSGVYLAFTLTSPREVRLELFATRKDPGICVNVSSLSLSFVP